VFTPIEAALQAQQVGETEFSHVLTTWRVENVRAVLRFLDAAAAQHDRP